MLDQPSSALWGGYPPSVVPPIPSFPPGQTPLPPDGPGTPMPEPGPSAPPDGEPPPGPFEDPDVQDPRELPDTGPDYLPSDPSNPNPRDPTTPMQMGHRLM